MTNERKKDIEEVTEVIGKYLMELEETGDISSCVHGIRVCLCNIEYLLEV